MIQCGIQAQEHFDSANQKISSDMKKAITESYATSVMALGANQLLDRQLRIQLVDPKERSPDNRLMYEVAMPPGSKHDFNMEYWDVEVVTLEEHSNEQVDDFLKRTKLASTKSYDQETIILCYINRDIANGKLWSDVSDELKKLNTPNNIFLIGKIHPTKPIYQLARVNPTFDSIIEYDVNEEVKKPYDKTGGTLFTPIPLEKVTRKPRRGINPFLED